jgi:signal transduction histidine kinase/CHASE3 domain sensor protein
MNILKKLDFTHSQIRTVYLVTTLVVLLISVYSFFLVKSLIDTSSYLNRTSSVSMALQKISTALREVESYKRAFILTKDSSLLLRRDEALTTIPPQEKLLDSLLAGDEEQVKNFNSLKLSIREKVIQNRNIWSKNMTPNIMEGVKIMNKINRRMEVMTAIENLRLETNTKEYKRLSFISPIFIVVVFIGAMLILLFSYNRLNNALVVSEQMQKNIETSNKLLQLQNEEIKKSEQRFLTMFDNSPIALTFGDIETGKCIYANNLFYEQFGLSPDEVIGFTSEEMKLASDEENLRIINVILSHLPEGTTVPELQKLPPNEKARILLELREKMFEHGFEVNYSRKNGELFPALVYFEIIEMGKKSYALSSYVDISEKRKVRLQLEKQNEDLIKMNKELESFNYISSHDLQEPLRKIQIITNRIITTEYKNLSETGKDYFKRMEQSANRMQKLIADLLSYSRTNTSERKFEKTDLNVVAEEAIMEMNEAIREKKATVEIGEMCDCIVIRFQFQQLMCNLISNSLKFSKPETDPLIKIKSKVAKGNSLNNEKLVPQKQYCHLSFSDNGIGFEPEYSEKIFDVFQRIHRREEYIGSGIGLSIVKKIVENHNGTITATSELNKGATFDIYIPQTDKTN